MSVWSKSATDAMFTDRCCSQEGDRVGSGWWVVVIDLPEQGESFAVPCISCERLSVIQQAKGPGRMFMVIG